MKKEKQNTFADLEKAAGNSKEVEIKEEIVQSGEVDLNDFSDTAVGEKIKYVRPDLNGVECKIDKFQVFMPIRDDEIKTSQSGSSRYWPVTMILSYDNTNEEGVQNREYISGAKCFEQRDGSVGPINFWYEGSGTQSAMLWELVAKTLNMSPEELSPRQFVAVLNGKPKVKIVGIEYKNYNAPAGAPKTIKKNMPGEFLKE